MTAGDALRSAAATLRRAGIEDPPGEAELLLAEAARLPRESIIAHPEAAVLPAARRRFAAFVRRRARREPFAYIVGRQAFYGRDFSVDRRVLVPRWSTETLIEAALARAPKDAVVFDIGTGSGAVGLTLAAELPGARTLLADVSADALAVARKNARRLGLTGRVRFARLDVMKPSRRPSLPNGFLVVAANLPYLETKAIRTVWPEVRKYEPRGALVSGKDGLDHYRALMERLDEWRLEPDLVLLEADPPQFSALKKIVLGAFPRHHLEIRKDLAGNDRILLARK